MATFRWRCSGIRENTESTIEATRSVEMLYGPYADEEKRIDGRDAAGKPEHLQSINAPRTWEERIRPWTLG